jgi:glycosyltransferase involved in cell wall biosynthesis
VEPLRLGLVQRGGHVGKGSEFLPDVLKQLPDDIKDHIELHICGEGWLASNDPCERWHGVHAVRYEEQQFCGMPGIYDYLLIPSLWEGGPMALLEACAAGRPVIAANVGWVREFVPTRVYEPDSRIFRPGDVSACAGILKELVERKLHRRNMVAHLTYEAYATTVNTFIEGLCK